MAVSVLIAWLQAEVGHPVDHNWIVVNLLTAMGESDTTERVAGARSSMVPVCHAGRPDHRPHSTSWACSTRRWRCSTKLAVKTVGWRLRISALTVVKEILSLAVLLWLAILASRLLERRITSLPNLTPSLQVLIVKLLVTG